RTVLYRDLHQEVGSLSRALAALGIGLGDRVAIHMGWLPEAIAALLACGRLGAIVSVIPVPLPAEAVADRLAAFQPRVLITQDGAWRGGVVVPLKARADEALTALSGEAVVEATIVVRRTGIDVNWYEGDCRYHEYLAANSSAAIPPPQPVPSGHPLLVHYLAGRRHQPVGVV